ncbi:hypothetical protein [Candidatus Villigracilis affinis]|uniref:type I restriction enzyme subunit R domain-containing protein n=1 Tax=Candidatus Villigracilis affinis TaxID=3140682 RepID=UPI0031E97E0A
MVKDEKYKRYADAPIYVIFTGGQDEQDASNLNEGMSEEKVLQEFAKKKNGLMIVVAKLQTGYDEKRLHTLFLDKEVREISAIQAISRVNRYTKNKHDCKIVDFSYNNVNIQKSRTPSSISPMWWLVISIPSATSAFSKKFCMAI